MTSCANSGNSTAVLQPMPKLVYCEYIYLTMKSKIEQKLTFIFRINLKKLSLIELQQTWMNEVRAVNN